MNLDERTAKAIIKCLEIDVDFYRDFNVFLMKKHTKVLQDDLDWLVNSLNDEQAYLMKNRSLDEKRTALFKGLGVEGVKFDELVEAAPAEYRPKMSMLVNELTEIINSVQELNRETMEIVRRKLDNEKEVVEKTGMVNKPETYNNNAAKVKGGQSVKKPFRNV